MTNNERNNNKELAPLRKTRRQVQADRIRNRYEREWREMNERLERKPLIW